MKKSPLGILSTIDSLLVSFTRRPFVWPCGRRQSFVTKLALGAKFAEHTKLTKNPSVPSAISVAKNNSFNPCKSAKSVSNFPLCLSVFVAKGVSIKMNKLCKTNPISEKPEMNSNPCSTRTNNKKL